MLPKYQGYFNTTSTNIFKSVLVVLENQLLGKKRSFMFKNLGCAIRNK